MFPRMVFVDLETTGANAMVDRITEIGIVLVDENGVRAWSQLIQPQARLPVFIEQLTGQLSLPGNNGIAFLDSQPKTGQRRLSRSRCTCRTMHDLTASATTVVV